MTGNTNINWPLLTNGSIVKQIGGFIKQTRSNKNITQQQLAETAGLNRWTVSQIEKGESITLTSLIQLLRALDILQALDGFQIAEEISPLDYAKLKKQHQKTRVRPKTNNADNDDLGW